MQRIADRCERGQRVLVAEAALSRYTAAGNIVAVFGGAGSDGFHFVRLKVLHRTVGDVCAVHGASVPWISSERRRPAADVCAGESFDTDSAAECAIRSERADWL